MVFNAITKQAVLDAMKHPRSIDRALVDAYLARRALDYLVGFTLSPVLWRKLPGARSAGRVQSVALRLVCDRELEIEKFVAREYWSLVATLATPRDDTFEARLVGADGKKIQRLDIGSGAEAEAFKRALENARFHGRHRSRPSPPSAIRRRRSPPRPCSRRRAASSALRRPTPCASRSGSTKASTSAARPSASSPICAPTACDIAPEAIAAARSVIGTDYGSRYVPVLAAPVPDQGEERAGGARGDPPDRPGAPPEGRQAHSRSRSGQALRADLAAHDGEPDGIRRARAHHRRHHRQGRAAAHRIDLRATGTVVKFDGFLTLYQEGQDDDADDEEARPPAGDERRRDAGTSARSTRPSISPSRRRAIRKPRWSSAWRSSASAGPRPMPRSCRCCKDRGYVRIDKKRLVPEDKGRVLTAFLESFFARYVEYDFTAGLEEQLDRISNNEMAWRDVLRDFWRDFIGAVGDIKELRIAQVIDALDEMLAPHLFPPRADGTDPRKCPNCGTGRLSLKLGKFGGFIGCSNYPECRYTRQLAPATAPMAARRRHEEARRGSRRPASK